MRPLLRWILAFGLTTVILSVLLADPEPRRVRAPESSEAARSAWLSALAVFASVTALAVLTWLATVAWGDQDPGGWQVLLVAAGMNALLTLVVFLPARRR